MLQDTDMHLLGKLPTSQNSQVETFRGSIIHQRFDHYTEIIIRVHEHTGAKMTIYTCRKLEVGTNCNG